MKSDMKEGLIMVQAAVPQRRKKRRITVYDVVICSIVAIISIISLLPFFYIFSVSFTDPTAYVPFKPILFPEKLSLQSYQFVLRSGDFMSALGSTVLITVVGTLLNIFITFSFAYGLTKRHLPLYGLFTGLVIFQMLFDPGIIPRYILVKDLGLLDSYWSCILPSLTNAWSVMVAKSFLDSIPNELEEAAAVDGCSQIGIFVKIILPLSLASLATLSLFFAVGNWNMYIKPLMYIIDPKKRTLQVYLKGLLVDGDAWGMGAMEDIVVPAETLRMSAVVLAMLPILVVYPFVQRYFIKGAMIGSVKG